MDLSFQEQAQKRASLLQHKIFSQLPSQALELAFKHGDFLTLSEARFYEYLTPEILKENTFFLLDGRLGIYDKVQNFCLKTIKHNEEFVSAALVQDHRVIPFSPVVTLFQLSNSEIQTMSKNSHQVLKALSVLELSLEAYCVYHHFGPPVLNLEKRLLDAFQIELFDTNQWVFKEGSAAKKFYLITQGSAKVLVGNDPENLDVVRTLGEGDYFGELGLLKDATRTASICASNQLAIVSIDKENFREIMESPVGKFIESDFTQRTEMYSFKEAHTIGSASDCSLRILDSKIAPQHIKIGVVQEQPGHYRYSVRPVCGDTHRYHTFVNKQLIHEEVILEQYDELVIGNYKVILDSVAGKVSIQKASFHTLQVSHLTYQVGQDTIIDNVSFTLQSNQLIALLGPSGSGKSTLLELLYGFRKPTKGKILYDQVLHEHNETANLFGLVAQDDVLYPELTVYENLFYDAKIRYPGESNEKINKRIDQVLEILKLSSKKHARVGSVEKKGLSGGQKKRVNIARELLFEPDILFLDEPVSGLSSRDAEEVLSMLRILSDMGKMVIMVMHQPSSSIYQMFDQAILLDEGGKLVFVGSAQGCLGYMHSHDEEIDYPVNCPQCLHVQPDKIFQILEKRDKDDQRIYTPEYWQKSFWQYQGPQPTLKTGELHLLSDIESSEAKVSGDFNIREHITQFAYLLKRGWITKMRDISGLSAMFLTPFFLALMIALIFRANSDGLGDYAVASNSLFAIYLFIAVVFSVFLGATGSAKAIVGEQALYQREYFGNLKNSWYLLSKFCVQSFFAVFQLSLFICICNYILGVSFQAFFIFFPYLYLTGIFGIALGLVLSSWLSTTEAVINVIPLILIPQMILGGALIPYEDMNPHLFVDKASPMIPEIAHLIPVRWSYEALVVIANNPRQSAISEMQNFRDKVLVSSWENAPEAQRENLENLIYAMDELSSEIEKIYPEDKQKLKNEALAEYVTQGWQNFFEREKDLGTALRYQPLKQVKFAHYQPFEKEHEMYLNWSFYAPLKSLIFRYGRLDVKTTVFNAFMLMIFTLSQLMLALMILNYKGKRT